MTLLLHRRNVAHPDLSVDLLDAKRLPIIGWFDEITSLAVAVQRMSKYITPEMEVKVDGILDQWFPIYAEFEEVTV